MFHVKHSVGCFGFSLLKLASRCLQDLLFWMMSLTVNKEIYRSMMPRQIVTGSAFVIFDVYMLVYALGAYLFQSLRFMLIIAVPISRASHKALFLP